MRKRRAAASMILARHVTARGPAKKLNVILVTVESLSARYLTRFGQESDITPFMDQWFKQGLLFTNFYATGTRTTRGLEAITLSIPPTPGRSIVKRPDNSHLYSLGRVFKKCGGMIPPFFYGGRGFFDNMNAFFSGNGYRIVDTSRRFPVMRSPLKTPGAFVMKISSTGPSGRPTRHITRIPPFFSTS